jgi:hypothetical protein
MKGGTKANSYETDSFLQPSKFAAAGGKINAAFFQELLGLQIIPWLKRTYPVLRNAFELHSVSAHAARTTMKFLRKNMTPAGCWSLYGRFRRPRFFCNLKNRAF